MCISSDNAVNGKTGDLVLIFTPHLPAFRMRTDPPNPLLIILARKAEQRNGLTMFTLLDYFYSLFPQTHRYEDRHSLQPAFEEHSSDRVITPQRHMQRDFFL